jgi:protein MpaA
MTRWTPAEPRPMRHNDAVPAKVIPARLPVLLLAGLLVAAMIPISLGQAAQAAQTAPANKKWPAVVQAKTIGHTVKKRGILAWRLGQPSAKRKVVIFAAMHGDETGPSRILYDLRDGAPIKGADIWVVPQYNRDGVVRHTRQNAHGVDLNRNFPHHWKHLTGATNSGPRAASEPETRAIMAFLRSVRPNFVVSFHQPLHGVGQTVRRGRSFIRRLHNGLGLPVKAFNCDGVCHGTMTEWFNANFPGVAVTVEYGGGVSRAQATRTGPVGLLRAVGAHR